MLEGLPEVVGRALRGQRAGLDRILFNRISLGPGTGAIEVRSLAFADHAPIPEIYTADGDGRSPPLQWTGVPDAATRVALVVEDADSVMPQPLVHAVVVDLPPGDLSLPDGAIAPGSGLSGRLGRNSVLGTGWLPPDPPPGHGPHRYVFQVFALAGGGPHRGTPGREAVARAIARYGIASGCLVGTYERPDASERLGKGAIAARAPE